MKHSKISIITINYNNLKGLKDTAESIINQTCKDFEWVIIDGGSTDGSKEYIESISEYADYWVSEPDKGIYNAMNKGTRKATGEYCLYMNSGDSIYDNTTIYQLNKLNYTSDVVSGIGTTWYNGKLFAIRYPKKETNLSNFVCLLPDDKKRIASSSLLHQATLIKRICLLATPYDEAMKIAADYKFWIQHLIYNNGTYETIDVTICRFDKTGVSSSPESRMEAVEFLESTLPERIKQDYLFIAKLRQNRIWKILKYFVR